MKRFLLVMCAVLLGACATPETYTTAKFSTYDKNTDYAVDDRSDGFAITVNYSRYQFLPESDAVAVACKSALTSAAYDVADKRGHKIDPINEQRIQISMGRNEFSGITSCSAHAVAQWASK